MWPEGNQPQLRDLAPLSNLRRLSTDLYELLPGNLRPGDEFQQLLAPLSNITHLEVVANKQRVRLLVDNLAKLTHIAFANKYSAQVVRDRLELEQLRVVAVIYTRSEFVDVDDSSPFGRFDAQTAEEEIKDARFCAVQHTSHDYVEVWAEGVRGGQDLWSQAEERVAERRRRIVQRERARRI
jgi:hypothetical protein